MIVPITLAYQSVDEQPVSAANRDLIYCYDDMSDVSHFWKLLALRRIDARVTIRPKIDVPGMKITRQAGRNLARIVTTVFWGE